MNFKRQSKDELSLNLTPLIDIVFLLLIFFMVSTTFTKENHLAINLPEASGEASEAPKKMIEVVIDKSGQYSINGQALLSNKLVTIKQAVQKMAGDNRDIPFIITADASTPHESVVRAMDAAGQLGFSRLSITSKQAK
ncbi:biopolymer transporter ExbD [Bermanella marisrubri]|uniref:Biopolymer transport protein n=1 Tax=Bermanella marisrubri TaxID=207949 RepID=Q1N4W4_9GAMM|nr:biopolymer transporter ExbD [Bermanella marisrubri]EAT13314.1 Biopolymer transport protein [Oceanobacter sp. RED65] [Bermanella marisrubri]QIZ84074.1 biopolymer transporter ExbD [Bermanella marisrubri]